VVVSADSNSLHYAAIADILDGSDGRVLVAKDAGSHGQMGLHGPEDNTMLAPVLPDDAELVHFGAHYIHCTREVTDFMGRRAEAQEWLRGYCVLDETGRRFGSWWVDDIATAMAHDYLPGEDMGETFRRFIDRT